MEDCQSSMDYYGFKTKLPGLCERIESLLKSINAELLEKTGAKRDEYREGCESNYHFLDFGPVKIPHKCLVGAHEPLKESERELNVVIETAKNHFIDRNPESFLGFPLGLASLTFVDEAETLDVYILSNPRK